MSTVILKENESFEVAIRRFRRMVERGGLLAEVRRRTCYEKPAVKRKRRKMVSERRYSQRTKPTQFSRGSIADELGCQWQNNRPSKVGKINPSSLRLSDKKNVTLSWNNNRH